MLPQEQLILLRDLPRQRWLPRPRGGAKRQAVSTFHRWRRPGVRGVRLRCIRVPSGWATTREWVAEFFEGLTRVAGEAPPQRDPTAAHARAEQILKGAGI
jgi:hypothetical protein